LASIPPEPTADLAGILHEVSNALTVVLGWLDAASNELPEGTARQAVDVARSHANRGYRLAREAIGADVAAEAERGAVSVAREAVLGVLQEARRRGVKVELVGHETSDLYVHDSPSALQILVNLLLNAIAFTPSGGTVELGIEERRGKLAYRVRDQGPGIPPERVATLWTAPASIRRGGAGIGLAHSAVLAKTKGGELRLAHPGPGAEFELIWPAPKTRSSVPARPALSLAGVRVLVIDDDPAVLSLVEFALEAYGVQVLAALSPAEVEDILANGQTFDAALVDLSPFAGAEDPILVKLAEAVSGSAVILISGLLKELPSELDLKVAAWVRKPFEMSEVVEVLSRIVAPATETPATQI
jgi:CheY-like chemotaxis protein